MQSLVVRYTVDVPFSQIAYVVNRPFEYKSVDTFLMDYFAWCDFSVFPSENGFRNLGIQPNNRHEVEVLSLEEWFWKYKRQ